MLAYESDPESDKYYKRLPARNWSGQTAFHCFSGGGKGASTASDPVVMNALFFVGAF